MKASQTKQLEIIKNRLTNGLLVAASIIGLPMIIASGAFLLPKGHWGIWSIYLALYLIMVATTIFRKNISFPKKALIGLSACYLMGAIILFRAGIFGIGPYLLLTLALICSLLFGHRVGILAVIISLFTFAVVAVASLFGLIQLNQDVLLAIGSSSSWVLAASVFAVFSLSLIISIGILQGYLHRNIVSLTEQSEKLDASNRRLQDEFDRVAQIQRDLEKSERKYRFLAEHASDVIWTMDANLNFTYVSPSVEKIFGYTIEQAMENRFENVLTKDALNLVLANLQKVIHQQENETIPSEPLSFEIQQTKADGSLLWTEVTLSLLALKKKDEFIIQGVTRDISKRKKQEETRYRLEERIHQAEKMKTVGTFAGGIAHDVNNILQIIMTNTMLIQMNIDDKNEINEGTTCITKAATQAAELIDKLLVFSRTGKVESTPFIFKDVISKAVETLRKQLPSEVKLISQITPDEGCVVGESGQIQRMLFNLANNSIAAMNKQGGTLNINVDVVEIGKNKVADLESLPSGRYFRMTVSDTGHGIDKELLPHIFDPFFTTKDVGDGTGLGLSVVHGVATAHGGCVTVESDIVEGAKFYVYLPRKKCELDLIIQDTTDFQYGTGTLLFVDDEPQQVRLGIRILENAGYQVVGANGGNDAMDKITKNPNGFDLLITDQNMPGITGLDLLRRATSVIPELKAILVTGRADDSIIKKSNEVDSVVLLPKPYSSKKLLKTIKELLSE